MQQLLYYCNIRARCCGQMQEKQDTAKKGNHIARLILNRWPEEGILLWMAEKVRT